MSSDELAELGYDLSTSAFVQQLHLQDGGEPLRQLHSMLQHAFLSMPHLQHLLLVSREDLATGTNEHQLPLPLACAELFSAVMQLGGGTPAAGGAWLFECSRQDALPPLQVRVCDDARVSPPVGQAHCDCCKPLQTPLDPGAARAHRGPRRPPAHCGVFGFSSWPLPQPGSAAGVLPAWGAVRADASDWQPGQPEPGAGRRGRRKAGASEAGVPHAVLPLGCAALGNARA